MAMTAVDRPCSAGRRSRRSPPLNRPPMIGTRRPSKLSMARRADSTLVAFESLTNRMPAITITGSSACSRPPNSDTALRMASGDAPASRAIAAAAATSDSRWRPISRTSLTGSSGTSSRPAARSTIQPSSSTVPSASFASTREQPPRRAAHASPPGSSPALSSALTTTQSPSPWFAKTLRLRRGVLVEVRVPVEVVGREVQQRRDPRVERRRRLELEAADLHDVDRLAAWTPSTSAASGAPMLPATVACKPRFRQHSARRASSSSTCPSCR